ncbi:hypothetical protein CSO01_22130 [Cellulomonas soli]|uniref:DUF726 domain-containing protein n=1 Tax=Cellulomonas soli TaxID=931535 RepID=A0A512PE93_9CELL|nr:hypothetical protein CSO01_22130 [Cellulomonas soli]
MRSLDYTPNGHSSFTCRLESGIGFVLTVHAGLASEEPEVTGDQRLTDNPALVENVLAFGKHEAEHRRLRNEERRASHRKQAAVHRKTAIEIAGLLDGLTSDTTAGRWCSGCLGQTDHQRVRVRGRTVPTYICTGCGSPTSPCLVPRCPHFANRELRDIALPRYCAEHRQEIPSFAKLDARLADISEYAQWLTFDKHNAARTTRLATVAMTAAVVVAPMAFVAAPAIGGVVGSLTGLSGAAATSHGLALLGGGSLAAGGLGMAGGTTVVTAMGASLGGALGAAVTSAYTSTDKSFRIELLRPGTGTPVLVANGFLTETTDGWGGWRRIVDDRYPDAPVYRVHWGAKELGDITALLAVGATKQATTNAAKVVAKKASKSAKIPGLAPLLFAADIATNPWTVAKARAGMTGAALAGIIARTDTPQFVLIGHSLGARVMATAAQTLGTVHGAPRIESVHLLGAAISVSKDWRVLSDAVSGRVWNYHSSNDPVLAYLYRTAELGKTAVGLGGFHSSQPQLRDRDVSKSVTAHSAYLERISLAR